MGLKVTLDSCCDHGEMVADDDLHRCWTRQAAPG